MVKVPLIYMCLITGRFSKKTHGKNLSNSSGNCRMNLVIFQLKHSYNVMERSKWFELQIV